MNIKSYLIVAMVLLATACANSTAKNGQTEEKQPIPEGAVEMKYNNHLYFKVMLRDSIACTSQHRFAQIITLAKGRCIESRVYK